MFDLGHHTEFASNAAMLDTTEHPASLPGVLRQHVDEAGALLTLRLALRQAPHVRLTTLRAVDERLAAHLDGISVSGTRSSPMCDALLDPPTVTGAFIAAVCAIAERDAATLDRAVSRSSTDARLADGLVAAFAWAEHRQLRGAVVTLLKSTHAFARVLGIASCSRHGVDPGLSSQPWMSDASPRVRAEALRAGGELGLRTMLTACSSATRDENPDCRFWAARSAVLLGDRHAALDALVRYAVTPDGPHRTRAFSLALQAQALPEAHRSVQQIAPDPAQRWWVIRGSGLAGDPAYVPWLIRHMTPPETARVAAEAFMTITGLDLFQGYEMPRPEGVETGPTDDPEDENVDMDPDEGLPWPDVERIERWWATNGGRFQKGQRYFMGAPVTREHCIHVLKHGYQRQRILAAHHLCLLEPGTPLFNTSAPAWRQQRLLAQMA